jgi:hypothetical protein
MREDEITVARWLIETTIDRVENYDAELREHLIAASNRLYDLTKPDASEADLTDV